MELFITHTRQFNFKLATTGSQFKYFSVNKGIFFFKKKKKRNNIGISGHEPYCKLESAQ